MRPYGRPGLRTGILGLAAVVLGLEARAETIPPKPVEGKIKWIYGYEEGKKEARQARKPLFVVFRCER